MKKYSLFQVLWHNMLHQPYEEKIKEWIKDIVNRKESLDDKDMTIAINALVDYVYEYGVSAAKNNL